MSSAIRVCPKCGAEIPADAPEGGCPGCLLASGLGLSPEPCEAGVDEPGRVDKPHSKKAERAASMLGELGDYELLEEVGRGGQGVVFRARQKSLNRTVALKVISLGQWASTAHLKRFRREAEAAASLDHPSIVPIYEVGERDGSCYFSMKFVEGGQLDEIIRRTPMSIRQAAELMAKVARTVHYAHEHGILHRDIKPGNILLDQKGEPLLTDFGLARLVETESTVTRTLEVLGTPSYMAPEQATGNNAPLTSATDVYGLGAVFYQLLTRHPPFAGGTTYETIKLLLDTEPRQPRLLNPKINRDLSTICLKCLEKDPKRRYPSALTLAEDLEHWLKHEPIRARRSGFFTHARKWVGRNPTTAVLVASLIALAAAMGWNFWKSQLISRPATKGIAVLPFENLSHDPDNSYFADGVQEEILTDLARIADLRVIGRSSVMQYKSGVVRDLRKIGQQLAVANVLEGSVQRSGNRVRVTADLIDARTDTHLWAERYDRDLADVFAIQSEIAKKIADQLQAKISLTEKAAIEKAPTTDLVAYDFYTRARNLVETKAGLASLPKENCLQAIDLLNQATARDPNFFDAYCELVKANDRLYFVNFDHTPERLALAETALDAASRLRPDAGELHFARAGNLYQGYLDYEGALAELEIAHHTLTNDPELFALKAYIARRQGRWAEAVQNLKRAIDLDPRNIDFLNQLAISYSNLRLYAEQKLVNDRVLAIAPNYPGERAMLASVEFDSKANTRPLHELIGTMQATDPGALRSIVDVWLVCALAERDPVAVDKLLIAAGEEPVGFFGVALNHWVIEGLIARVMNNEEKARSAFIAAREEQEKVFQRQPNYGPALCALGLIDAGLGDKENALREGRRALELLPVEKDSILAPQLKVFLAIIAAWVGEKELACEQLAVALRYHTPLSYGQLKLLPFWDPLRSEPCFEELIEEAKKPIALK
jgi:serine/threonine protein kinase